MFKLNLLIHLNCILCCNNLEMSKYDSVGTYTVEHRLSECQLSETTIIRILIIQIQPNCVCTHLNYILEIIEIRIIYILGHVFASNALL